MRAVAWRSATRPAAALWLFPTTHRPRQHGGGAVAEGGNRDRTWRHGSRFLLSIAGACAAAAIVLRLAASFEMAKAGGLWTDYGLMLMVAAAIFAVLVAFKDCERVHVP
jgi:hypothetical protein